VISHSKFLQIQMRIADQERKKLAEERARIEQEIRREKEAFAARVKQEADAKVAAIVVERDQAASKVKEVEGREARIRQQAAEAEARTRVEAEKTLAAVKAERDQATSKVKEIEAREARIRQQAAAEAEARTRVEAEKALAAVKAERDQAASKVKEVEAREARIRQQAATEAETRTRAEAEKALAAVKAERDQAASKVKEIEAREARIRQQAATEAETRTKVEAEKTLAAAKAEHEKTASKLKELQATAEQHQRVLGQQRQVLEQDRDLKLLKKDADHNREREQLQYKIDGLTRSLQHKTANDLGDGAEIDIYEALRDAFVGDDISRIKKGQQGADIRHRVMHKGAVCGTVLIDSKNRQGWQNAYVTKLREDQVTDKAEHALLATIVFPSGRKELYIDEETGVVVVSRARTVEMVRLLRDAMVRMHCLGLSLEQRAEKRDLLYKYLSSENYRQHLTEANRVTSDLLELDTDEKHAHDKVWEKRGRMTTRLRNVVRDIDTEVSAILEGRGGTQN